ncbi:MAG TPA: glucose 1-dehydrogenase [Ilumatobacteraceae bacterium]|jgi:NAD(P)-dependent dehydrogenase (short-subunit alcohol dehydrogenase family)
MSSDPLFRLDGKVAVVTGGSRGLGRSIAMGLAAAGADVVIASRKLDACERTADEIAAATGRRASAIACHVGRWADCDALFTSSIERFGTIDVLVNNAGVSPLYGTDPRDVTDELWQKVIAINLGGPFRLSALFGAHMSEANGGSIINISSGAATHATAEVLPYAAAKAGLHALTTGFAHTLGPRVRVNAIVCGRFRTDVSEAWDMDALREVLQRTQPLQRVAEPDEIIGTAVYLASDASSYTTGAFVTVDGGAAV